jgi:beta-xylosidase
VCTGGGTGGAPGTGGAGTGGAPGSGGAGTGGLPGSGGGDPGSGGSGTGGGPGSGGTGTGGDPGSGGDGVGGDPGSGGDGTGGDDPGSGGSGTGGGECQAPAPGTSGTNPLFTEIHTADPAPMVHNCTFYIACGHDEGTTGFALYEWYVLSSTDMVNWSDNGGPALSLNDFSWANANAWAGHLTERNGSFYWYVPINQSGGAMTIGVAVASNPTGPYTDAIGGPLITDQIEMDNWNYGDAGETPYTIDPAAFVDDDGQAYLYYGGFWRLVGVPLNDDMISLAGPLEYLNITGAPGDGGIFEAPFVFKREGTYYIIYAANQNPATIDYATSNDPMGPFHYEGRILDTLPNNPGEDAATSHPGAAEFAGQWYLVYHLSDGPNGGTYRRQVAVDKMYFNSDGTIDPVTPSSGLTF